MGRERKALGKRVVHGISEGVNFSVLILLLLLLCFGIYALWDSALLYSEASHNHYKEYKPAHDRRRFEDYVKVNKDVIGWIELYGTGCDYPIVQGKDNIYYLNHTADGRFQASGSLYLDYRNQSNFQDYNNIIYGHHMDQHMMLGDLSLFLSQDYFQKHQYGKIYANHHWWGLDIYALLETDANNTLIYHPGITSLTQKQTYQSYIQEKARYIRSMSISEDDHLVLLSTCEGDITNGRMILVCKMTNKIHKNPFIHKSFNLFDHYGLLEELKRCPLLVLAIVNLLFLLCILFLYNRYLSYKRKVELEK